MQETTTRTCSGHIHIWPGQVTKGDPCQCGQRKAPWTSSITKRVLNEGDDVDVQEEGGQP